MDRSNYEEKALGTHVCFALWNFGIPVLSGIVVWLLADLSYVTYMPLTWIESGFWFIVPRQYSFNDETQKEGQNAPPAKV